MFPKIASLDMKQCALELIQVTEAMGAKTDAVLNKQAADDAAVEALLPQLAATLHASGLTKKTAAEILPQLRGASATRLGSLQLLAKLAEVHKTTVAQVEQRTTVPALGTVDAEKTASAKPTMQLRNSRENKAGWDNFAAAVMDS